MSDGSYFSELRKRKVVQAAAIYGAVAWGVTEVLITIVEQLFLPQWVSTLTVIFFVVGFPVAMFLSWTFDFTAEGIRRTDIKSKRGTASIVASMALLLAGTVGLFLLIRPSLETGRGPDPAADLFPNSVIVLPFESASRDPQDGWLVASLSDELRDQLGRQPGIRIAARSSSIVAREQGLSAQDITSKLKVAHVIEGNLRRLGSGWRVSVQLIEGKTGLALWSETFERGPNELLIVQQAIAELVVRTVLPGAEVEIAEPATRDINANELMLLARHYEQQVWNRQEVDVDTQLEVVRLYREATEADPDSALAHSRLAGALIYLGDLEAAEAAISRALLLGPELSEVQNTLGEYYWARGLPGAKAAFAKAIELNRNNTDAIHNYHYAQWLAWDTADRIDELEALLRHALDLDRLSVARHAALGEFLGQEGREDGVRQVIEGIRDLFDSVESYRAIARLKEMIGELDQAIGWTLRARALEPDNPDHLHQLADLYAIIGDFETAQMLEPAPGLALLLRMRRYEELIDQAEFLMIEDPSDIVIKYMLAFAYQATSQYESALHILSSTGLPDTALNDQIRSAHEHWAFLTLINALAGAGTEETLELANSLAEYNDMAAWHGDMGSIATARSCTLAILGRHAEARQLMPRMKESGRLVSKYLLQDAWCFRQYAETPEYLEALRDQDDRRARLREILPATLTEFGVSL